MTYLLWLVLVLVGAAQSEAAVRYISPTGSNGNTGTSSASPWLTWAYAFSNTSCGDTLIVMSGTYTATNGAPTLTKVCTASTMYTVKAQVERQAFINGNGTWVPFYITSSSYITIEGLRLRSADVTTANGGANFGIINAYHSNHITFRHILASHPNRNRVAGHVYQLYNTYDSVVEESEAYSFHRHGFFVGGGGSRNIFRRNYCNGRGYADITGGDTGSYTPPTADDCFISYPGSYNVFENNIAEGAQLKCFVVEASATSIGNKFYGNICLGGATNGFAMDARGSTLDKMPRDTIFEHNAAIDTVASAFRWDGMKNAICRNCTALGGAAGIEIDRLTAQPGDGIYSAFVYNSIFKNMTGVGVLVTSPIQTWSYEGGTSHGNGTAYNPASHANYNLPDTPATADPGLGTCKVWRPDGSTAKTNNWGSEILYRYEAGILTDIKLWNSVTGEFPHGAIVAGVNDVAGSSVFDVHARLNVNSNGCAFPAGYGGSSPTNPAHVVATTNLDGAHVHVIPAGMDSLLVGVLAQHDALSVADPLTVTSSCGTQDIPPVTAVWYTASGDKSMRVFGKIGPTSGTCTITPTFSNGNTSGWVVISIAEDNVSSFGDTSAASGQSGIASTTALVNSADRLVNFLATGSVPPISVGDHQILWTDKLHASKDVRGAVSTQQGIDGGNTSYALGAVMEWITQSVVLSTGGGGSGSTFRVTNYRIDGLLGMSGNPEVTLGQLADQNIPASVGLSGAFRIRAEILVETASSTATGTSLYCRRNAGVYARVLNTFGSNVVRFYGPGVETDLPLDGQATSQRFTGTFQAGKVWRDGTSVMLLDSIPANTRTEVDYLLVQGNGITPNDVTECEIRTDSGATFGVHTVLPTVRAVSESASMGF